MRRAVGFLAAAFLPAVIGAPFVRPGYYERLRKPSWAPPSGIFGPVWTLLYAMIGTAAWLVSQRERSAGALRLWGVQLALNAAWTPLFFGARARGLSLVEIGLMWVAIAATTVSFFSRRPLAAALMIPYLAWVTFATGLTYEVWRRND
jgi:tryptophan-rich sensory protein